ncbi:MAG: hypothetical protein Ct9H300mP11_21970 [Chloroflexota bacterium]|nr:MAG: hypothetical protein Ct9H300mP11_21970 [Chloroflexota bacterium]
MSIEQVRQALEDRFTEGKRKDGSRTRPQHTRYLDGACDGKWSDSGYGTVNDAWAGPRFIWAALLIDLRLNT